MDRTELTAIVAAALFGALVLGWVLRWIFGRIDASGPRGVARTADMATRLHEAEAARDRAEQRLARIETDLGARLGEVEAELNATLDQLAKARDQADNLRAAYREATARPDHA